MPFEHHLTARFYHVDAAGIVFFGRFYEFCHDAFEALLAAMFGPPATSLAAAPWALPLVHSEADYERVTRLGDVLTVRLRVDAVGRHSVRFAYDVCGADGGRRARVALVHAFVDPQHFRPVPVPDDFVAGLRRLRLWPPGDP